MFSPDYKAKILALELLINCIEFFTQHPIFKEFVHNFKDRLCEILLKNCVCQDKNIFAPSFKIFLDLVLYFKEFIKAEISLFVEEIFFKILNSQNSSFPHRESSLKVLKIYNNYFFIKFF